MICEICSTQMKILDKHHIISKSKGGTNDKYNICRLCPNCHRKVHSEEIIIEGKFMTSMGLKVIYHEKNKDSILNQELPKVHVI